MIVIEITCLPFYHFAKLKLPIKREISGSPKQMLEEGHQSGAIEGNQGRGCSWFSCCLTYFAFVAAAFHQTAEFLCLESSREESYGHGQSARHSQSAVVRPCWCSWLHGYAILGHFYKLLKKMQQTDNYQRYFCKCAFRKSPNLTKNTFFSYFN